MDNLALGNIFAGQNVPRSVTIGTGAMVSTIQIPQTAKAPNRFNFEELKNGFIQAKRQVENGARALALVIRYRPEITNIAGNTFAETGWQSLNGQLFGRTFDRIELSPYKDTEFSFDLAAREVIASKLLVHVDTDKKEPTEVGIGVDLDAAVAITCDGLIYPRSALSN
jgi:hypothetical protein